MLLGHSSLFAKLIEEKIQNVVSVLLESTASSHHEDMWENGGNSSELRQSPSRLAAVPRY
jgi:hypothetical protein